MEEGVLRDGTTMHFKTTTYAHISFYSIHRRVSYEKIKDVSSHLGKLVDVVNLYAFSMVHGFNEKISAAHSSYLYHYLCVGHV